MKPDISRFRRGSVGRLKTIPLAFMAAILAGTVLLSMPFARSGRGAADVLTALFTATSATCVTGLTVVDTATYWSFGGRLVILMLIQIGGLGVMMLAAAVALAAGRRMTIGQRMLLGTSISIDEVSGLNEMVKTILAGTFIFELAGAALITLILSRDMSMSQALERGIFLSVSAFCNAGFDNLGVGGDFASIIPYGSNIPLLLVLSALIIVGGIGFYVWRDLIDLKRSKKRLSLHSRLVLRTTGLLIVAGMLGFLLTEFHGGSFLGDLPHTLAQAFFQSVTTRTAGFDHLGQNGMTSASRALSDILMLIGGSPGSIAGGVKTTTVAVIALAAVNSFYGRRRVTVLGRTIPEKTVSHAMSLLFLVGSTALCGAFAISIADGVAFSDALYESISAIATVGLSTGITPGLGMFSRVLLIVLMFLGRVGIVTVGMAALMRSSPDDSIRLPEGKVIIG